MNIAQRHLEMYNAVLNTGDADTRGHLQSESEKMSHFLKVVLFKLWIFNHEFHDMSW